MRSIFLMSSDDLAGDAMRRVPLPWCAQYGRNLIGESP